MSPPNTYSTMFTKGLHEEELDMRSGLELRHIAPIGDWQPNANGLGSDFCISRGFHDHYAVYQGLPLYWFREASVDSDKVVWMKQGETIGVTSRQAWDRVMDLRREILAQAGHHDYHKDLGLDVVLGPYDKPQSRGPWKRQTREMVSSPEKQVPSRIPRPLLKTTRKYQHFLVNSDRMLLSKPRRRGLGGFVLKVHGLAFMGWKISGAHPAFAQIYKEERSTYGSNRGGTRVSAQTSNIP